MMNLNEGLNAVLGLPCSTAEDTALEAVRALVVKLEEYDKFRDAVALRLGLETSDAGGPPTNDKILEVAGNCIAFEVNLCKLLEPVARPD